jgi:hypothetical protein
MRFCEFNPIKPLNPEQLRIKSMQDQIKKNQKALKAERARQRIQKAQHQLLKLNKSAV